MPGEKGGEEALLIAKEVAKRFQNKEVLEDINLEIYPREIFGIIGVSGVGKTTLLELLIGFLKNDKGSIAFKTTESIGLKGSAYRSVFKEQKKFRTIFGFAAQTPSFYDDLTVEENLAYFGSLYNLSDQTIKENTNLLLGMVGLSDSKQALAGNLSGGMQKRLDIACAMIHNPKILILDEPTADLDVLLRKQMWDLVRNINEKGTTVIIASHFLDEIESLCDRIALLHNRSIVWKGSVEEMKKKYTKSTEIHLETLARKYPPIVQHLPAKKLGVTRTMVDGRKLIIYSDKAELTLHYLIHYLEKNKEHIVDVELKQPSLSEVFEEITK